MYAHNMYAHNIYAHNIYAHNIRLTNFFFILKFKYFLNTLTAYSTPTAYSNLKNLRPILLVINIPQPAAICA